MTLPLKVRQERFAAAPWIRRLPAASQPCAADSYWARRGCKLRGHWRFKALRPRRSDLDGFDVGVSGTYCWHHLMQQIWSHEREAQRFRKWAEKRWP